MKYFATGFFLKKGTISKDVINECLTWVSESPHTRFIPAQLDMYRDRNDEFHLNTENEDINLIRHCNDKINMICFRYLKRDSSHTWITDISINEYIDDGSLWVQIQSDFLTQDLVYKSPTPKPPLVVIKLLEKFSGGADDIFEINIEPIYLNDNEEDINLASKVINSTAENRIPVVYVSARHHYYEHAYKLIPERLARKLSGLAHVVVEPADAIFSTKLKHEVNAKNVYGGAIGIYWPDGQEISIYKRESLSAKEFERLIFDEITKSTTSLIPLKKCGWDEIHNIKTRQSIIKLKAQGNSSDELISLLDNENTRLENENKELQNKVNSLEDRIKSLQGKRPSQGDIFLNTGDEDDYFDGEILEFIIRTLQRSLSSIKDDSRHYHIISALIENNSHKNKIDELDKKLKQILTGYNKITPKIESALTSIGFDIDTESNRHIKLTYHGDNRYVYFLSRTGSDYRGPLNAYSDISKIVFI